MKSQYSTYPRSRLPISLINLNLCLACLFVASSGISQDTLFTNYPGSSKKWEKIYHGANLLAENIYHDNGAQWMTVRYDQPSDEKWKWYYDNGSPYFEATIVHDELQGLYSIWYENGQLAERIEFKDNLENGVGLFYYPSGQLAMQGLYKNGAMTGDWQFFDPEGRPAHGAWQWVFAASAENIRIQGVLEHGIPVGTWQYKSTANQGRANQLRFTKSY